MRKKLYLILSVCSLGLVAHPAASKPKQAVRANPPAAAPADPTIIVRPDIRAALNRMAGAMQGLQSFQVQIDMTTEEVLETGQKVQSSSVVTADAMRPNRLYMDIASERRSRQLYYDGKTVTLFGPVQGYYAQVPAPPTTYTMLKEAAERYDLNTPLMDLMEWGTGAVRLDRVSSAMYAGPDRIAGQLCDHYAFRQPSTDWQVWIPRSDPAFPCKLVIVNTQDSSQPQTTAVFTWTPSAHFDEDRFAFAPPAGAQRIALGRGMSSK